MRVFLTPIYLVNRLYATHLGAERLAATWRPDLLEQPRGHNIPQLDAVASRSADGRRIFIKAVNTDLERSLVARIGLGGAHVSSSATVKRVVADSIAAINGFATPDAVRVTSGSIRAGNRFSLELPRHSVSVVTLTVVR